MGELHLVHGTDEPLVGQAVVELSRRLVGSGDERTLEVSSFPGERLHAGAFGETVAALVQALDIEVVDLRLLTHEVLPCFRS